MPKDNKPDQNKLASNINNADPDLIISLEKHRLIIQHRYEVLHILNDIAIAIWFLIGSIFFLFSDLVTSGTWLFVIGSAQMLIRPVIRIAHKIHLRDTGAKNIHF